MISANDVSFSYCSSALFENLNCAMADGRITALLGPNGSGKSTLLRLCAGLLKPSRGSITIDGGSVASLHPRQLARRLAFLPQSRPTPAITVYALVASGRFPYLGLTGKLSAADREAVEHSLELTGLIPLAERELRTLSGGERQKAYIAMLIAQGAQHLLLDEPTTYLDINHRIELMELLQKLRDDGRCIVTVLHDIDLAMEFCDEAAVMHNGSIIHTGKAAELCGSGAIQRAYSVEPMQNSGLRYKRI